MTLRRPNEEFILGEDLDFDQLNEQIVRTNAVKEEKEELPNPLIDRSNLYGGPSSPTKFSSSSRRRFEEPSLKETPAERLNRLKGEMRELKEELEAVMLREKEIKIANPETQATLLRDIETMQNQIVSIYQNEGIAKVIQKEGAGATEGEKELLDLKANLKYHKAEALLTKLKELQKAGGKEGESIVYKINLKTTEEPGVQEAKVSDIENRIANLENLFISSDVQNLLEDVQKVKKSVDSIAGSSMDQVTKKLNQVSQELDTLQQKKTSFELNDPRLMKAEKMYEAYLKLQRIGEHLPEVVQRLECLKVIHEESATISDKITNIKHNQTKINESLKEGNELLEKVNDIFGKNLARIEGDIKNLQERIEKK